VSNGAQVSHAVINVAVAKINGTVEGDINATKELVLGPTANVTGNISARLLTVQEGALLNGGCAYCPPPRLRSSDGSIKTPQRKKVTSPRERSLVYCV
jgi:cytoskeletal protein CcmA (bactofilin family)